MKSKLGAFKLIAQRSLPSLLLHGTTDSGTLKINGVTGLRSKWVSFLITLQWFRLCFFFFEICRDVIHGREDL